MSSLAFDRLGAGEPLVLVHGLGSARTTWAPLPAMWCGADAFTQENDDGR